MLFVDNDESDFFKLNVFPYYSMRAYDNIRFAGFDLLFYRDFLIGFYAAYKKPDIDAERHQKFAYVYVMLSR